MPQDSTIVWLRNDLRVADHAALCAAVQRGRPVVPVFIWSPDEEHRPPGGASRWWLHQSLSRLAEQLATLKSRLIVRAGPALETLNTLIRDVHATAVYFSRRFEPAVRARDAGVERELRAGGIDVQTFNAGLLFEPDVVRTGSGGPYKVFTPFWRRCLSYDAPARPLPVPARLIAPERWPTSLELAELKLEPRLRWDTGLCAAWSPGAAGAAAELSRFLAEGMEDYAAGRDRPDRTGTSRLSPFLHFGEISPREIWHGVTAEARRLHPQKSNAIAEPYLRQIIWREFAYHLLYHFPETPAAPLRAEFAEFPWRNDRDGLRAWQQGRTGFPYIDAGMRELWATGWMHNRVRMAVASFLVKDLLIDWQAGADWFWDTLVDADLANNTLGWQWTAGCGADAAPFFRVFNPVAQGEKFDPQGDYVRRWVPELARLSASWIHKPWLAPQGALSAAGVEPGTTYPRPIVDHAQARERALASLAKIKTRK